MECFAGAATAATAGAATAATGVYSYNRDNFMYDRQLRLEMEYKIQDFRVEQAKLWREDVRDLISLSEYKMHIYLLVNVLLLGHSVVLWCQGKLPPNTPDWLMAGMAISTCGAFMFLLLSIWMAMHAAVAAQAYEARLLTQLVRLPIPSWQEIESCRTAASEFETVEAKQILRVPFAQGAQERFVCEPIVNARSNSVQEGSPVDGDFPGSPTIPATPSVPKNEVADPWGLERKGTNLAELGCLRGSEVAQTRHIRIARQAMIRWQSYDAFSRISMSIGVNQLLLAMSYYLLGYVLVEVGTRYAATCGVVLFVALAETLLRLDLSMSLRELRQVQILLALGPVASTVACYWWTNPGAQARNVAEASVTIAFVAHGAFIVVMSHFAKTDFEGLAVKLPKAFSSVLYLDVFGWVQSDRHRNVEPTIQNSNAHCPPQESDRDLGHHSGREVNCDSPAEVAEDYEKQPIHGRLVDVKGRKPIPQRPEDRAPKGCGHDMRALPGAPRLTCTDPTEYENTLFYDADSWLRGGVEQDKVFGGHGGEAPRLLPWHVFTTAMRSLCAVWFIAAIYHSLSVCKGWDLRVTDETHRLNLIQTPRAAYPSGSIHTNSPTASISMETTAVAKVPGVLWPTGLACDQEGQRFLLMDGFSIFTIASPGILGSAPEAWQEIVCEKLEGEGLQDIALLCEGKGGSQNASGSCEVLGLHANGRRLSGCSLAESQSNVEMGRQLSSAVSDSWLERRRSVMAEDESATGHHSRLEKAVAIDYDHLGGQKYILGNREHILLATTHGRVVELREGSSRAGLIPSGLRLNSGVSREVGPSRLRLLSDHYFSILENGGRSLLVLDGFSGTVVGQFDIPISHQAAGFCIGGGFIYTVGTGPGSHISRFRIPSNLHQMYKLSARF